MVDDKALRVRSPNYPAIGLGVAIEAASKIRRTIHKHNAPRDVVLSAMGYKTYNGASAPVLSALIKYGLLEKVGSDFKLTDRAMSIEHPRSEQEKAEAIKAALYAPTLWAELLSQFDGGLPDDALVRANLLRRGFSASAVAPVIHALRDSVDLAGQFVADYGAPQDEKRDEAPMLSEAQNGPGPVSSPEPPIPARFEAAPSYDEGEREILHGQLSRSSSYRLVAKGEVGPRELRKLIRILELQTSFLEDDDEDEAAH